MNPSGTPRMETAIELGVHLVNFTLAETLNGLVGGCAVFGSVSVRRLSSGRVARPGRG
jgi:hypothetical protein